MSKVLWNLFQHTAIIIIVAYYLRKQYGVSSWWLIAAVLVLGIASYLINVLLIKHYIAKRAPEMDSTEEVALGIQTWELTAGLGIVPKWASYVGLVSYSCFTAAVVLIVWALVA